MGGRCETRACTGISAEFDSNWPRLALLYCPLEAFLGLWPLFLSSWTHLCHQTLACEVNVGQCQCGECSRGVLLQTTVAHFAKAHSRLTTPKTCSTRERMRDLLRFFARTASSMIPAKRLRWLVKSLRLRRLAGNQNPSGWHRGRVAIDAPLVSMQQVR